MVGGQPHFGDNPWGYSIITPTDSNRAIAMNEDEVLGCKFNARSKDGRWRVVQWVKNVSGSTLNPREVLKYSTSAGRWGLDVTICADDTDPCCGVVPEEYGGGVPTGKWFCMVKYGHMRLKLQTTSDARVTVANGGVLVASGDNGQVVGQNGTAANAAVQNRVGYALQATTEGVDNGALINALVDVMIP